MPRDRLQWRLQQLAYRSNFDKLVQTRATVERAGESTAMVALARYSSSGSSPAEAISIAENILASASAASKMASMDLWIEMRVWAEAVFQSVHEQWSVPVYGGEYVMMSHRY